MTKEAAGRYLRALYANVPEASTRSKSSDGIMVALMIPQDVATALSTLASFKMIGVEGAAVSPASEMHITLAYLGSVDMWSPDQLAGIESIVAGLAIEYYDQMAGEPLVGEVQGSGRFNHVGDGLSALYYTFSSPSLPLWQAKLTQKLREAGLTRPEAHGYVPHITYAYVPEDTSTPTLLFPDIPIEFSQISLCVGPDRKEYQLSLSSVQDMVAKDTQAQEGFLVYKTASGQVRWVGYSSNGFEDREEECVSTAALEEDCTRADALAQLIGQKAYGPLRYWHAGEASFERPGDWTSVTAGPGVDLGMCDFNIVVNGVLIESGTFFDPEFAEVLGPVAKEHRLSIAFAKPRDEPDGEKVYNHIRRYERSLVPLKYALPSNRFTSFNVTEV